MPGEHLWRRVVAGNESDDQWLLIAILIPLLVGLGALLLVVRLPASWTIAGLVGFVVLFVFSLLLCVRWLQQRLQRRADDYLGFFGERYVAEILDPLKATSWFIFHDVQCSGATGKFNLDHVAVGPGGVWVIETKTRRKGRARPGFKEQNVAFDGKQIIWPWGEDTGALQQTRNNVSWLKQWLQKMTGKEFPVYGVLTFPGYYVTEQKLADIRVVYTKGLRDVVISHGNAVLRPDDVDLIRRQLEEKCRDVEY
jgi:xanthosine utilization system XapX-like protein